MSELLQFTIAIFGGTFFGSFLGPLLLEEWKLWQRRRRWQKPREKIVKTLFSQTNLTSISLEDIARTIGSTQPEAREILISMGAIGSILSNGQEAWILDQNKVSYEASNPK